MKTVLDLLEAFEVRNNISVEITLFGDRSGLVAEFWDGEKLTVFQNMTELKSFLRTVSYELDETGRCYSPVRKK